MNLTGSTNYLNTLNNQQKEAVLHDQGPLLIWLGQARGKQRFSQLGLHTL